MLSLADNCAVTAPGILVQLIERFDDMCAYRVEMDIPDQGEQVVFFVAKDGLVAVLEQVASSLVAAVEILGIPGQELAHDR